jgi:TetR/AcrR family transcriptional regulator
MPQTTLPGASALRPVFPSLAGDGRAATGADGRVSTRQALLAAAVAAFGQLGYDGVSIREIERRAGVNRGLVAHYFGTKDVLWRATVDWLMGEFASELARYDDVLSLVSPAERPRIITKVCAHFISKYPQYFRLILIEGDVDSERSRLLTEHCIRPVEEFWQRATGVDPDLPRERHAMRHFMLFGAMSVIFAAPEICRQMFGFDPSDPEFVDQFADVIAEMWLRIRDVVEH